MDTIPQPSRRKSKSDLVHLRSLPSLPPATKIGQVTWAWEEIEAALAVGMKLKEVWEAANKDGLDTSSAQFRVYTSRIRQRHQQAAARAQPLSAPTHAEHEQAAPPASEPFRNLREQREKKKRSDFEFDPFFINKNLIG